jgi:DNA primase
MISTIERIYATLLDRDCQRKLFGELEGFGQKGNAYIARCPFHQGDPFPTMLIHTDKPEYFCFVCSRRGDWLDFLQTHRHMSFDEAISFLAGEAGQVGGSYTEAEWRKELSRTMILETAMSLFITELWSGQGAEVLHYLYHRGYAMGEVEGMALGSFPGHARTGEYLSSLGFSRRSIAAVFPVTDRDDPEPLLVIPYRSASGRLMGLISRSVRQNTGQPYVPITDLSCLGDTPFNLYRSRGQNEVIVVEGLFDALLLDQVRLKPVISIGSGGLTAGRIEAAEAFGARHFLLALGNGARRERATRAAIGLIREKGLQASVLPIPARYADLDQYIRGTCLDHFKALLQKRMDGGQWLAKKNARKRKA